MDRYLWVVLPLIVGVHMAESLSGQGIPVLYPFIQSELGLSRAQVGLITSASAAGGLATVLLAGWLIDSLGVKRMVSISLFSMAALTIVFPLAYSWPLLLSLAVSLGVAASPGNPGCTRAVMDWAPSRIRALVMGVKQTGITIGGALTAVVLPVLAAVVGWRMAAAAIGIPILIVAIVFLLIYRDAPKYQEGARQSGSSTLQTMRTILRNRSLVTVVIWTGTFAGLHYVVLSYFMLFLIEELRFSIIAAGGLLAIAHVTSGIARVLWGAASDFVFHRRRIAVLAIAGLLTITWLLGLSLLGAGVPGTIVLLTAIVIGISALSYQGVSSTLVAELAEAGHVGVTAAVMNMMNRVGMLTLPPLFGYLVDVTGSYSLAWRVAAAVALVATLALFTFGREPQNH